MNHREAPRFEVDPRTQKPVMKHHELLKKTYYFADGRRGIIDEAGESYVGLTIFDSKGHVVRNTRTGYPLRMPISTSNVRTQLSIREEIAKELKSDYGVVCNFEDLEMLAGTAYRFGLKAPRPDAIIRALQESGIKVATSQAAS